MIKTFLKNLGIVAVLISVLAYSGVRAYESLDGSEVSSLNNPSIVGDLLPEADGVGNVGSLTKRWANVYADNGDFTTATISAFSAGDLLINGDGLFGSTSTTTIRGDGGISAFDGGITVNGNATSTSFSISNNKLTSTEFSNLVGLNQSVATTDSPVFNALTVTNQILTSGSWAQFQANQANSNFEFKTVAGTGQIQFTVNGNSTPSMFVDDTGFIGIATSTPNSTLNVNGAIVVDEVATSTLTTIEIDWAQSNQHSVTLNEVGHTVNFINFKQGQTQRLVVCQDGTGSRTVTTWDSSILWSGGSAPTLTTTADKCDVMTFFATTATSTLKVFGGSVLDF